MQSTYLASDLISSKHHIASYLADANCICNPPLNINDPDARFFTDSRIPHHYALTHWAYKPFLSEISGGCVVTHQGLIFDETTFYYDSYHDSELVKTVAPVAPYVGSLGEHNSHINADFAEYVHCWQGALTSFVTPHAANYHHWVLETLPKFYFLEQRPDLWDSTLLLPPLTETFQKDTLQKVFSGCEREVKIAAMTVPAIRADLLVYPSFLARSGHSSLQLDWLRSKFLGKPQPGKRRIYIPRGNSKNGRQLLGEAKLIDLLCEKYGFESYQLDLLSHDTQVRLFSNAEIIVGVSGAGFTNHIFAPHSAHVIEFHPRNYTNRAHFFTSNILEQTYQFVIGDNDVDGNLRVSFEKVFECIERVL